jgi:hypothetical protein
MFVARRDHDGGDRFLEIRSDERPRETKTDVESAELIRAARTVRARQGNQYLQ